MASVDLQKFCDELRAKISIVDVVASKVKLVRKGREYQACCPFHNEKTPSFTVNEAKGFYHCFGCGAHGDIIKFEMEANNLPFMDAVKKLADKAGLPMPILNREQHEEHEKKKSLYDIMEMACKYYEKCLHLPEGEKGMEYFRHRGLDDETIHKFRLGYAPNNNGLKAFLSSQNISDKDMNDLGLLTIPEDNSRRPHDFFRDRVMIPIQDKQGRVIAFGGRIMGDGQPKYLNSPETPIFNKRRVLYNLNNARDK
jgi:DNA primase